MKVLSSVEFVILQGIDDVEADQPENHDDPEQDRDERRGLAEQRRKRKTTGDRQPGADGRQSQRQPKPNVSVVGEPFGQRIEADQEQRDRGKVKANGVEKPTRRGESNRTESPKRPGAGEANLATGQMAHGRPGIRRVEFAVYDSIKSHRA